MTDAPPFSLVGLDHVVFLVDDMPRALDFYGRVLGCQPGYSYPALGMEQVWCGAQLIVLWDTTHPGAANAVPPVTGGRNVDQRVKGGDAPAVKRFGNGGDAGVACGLYVAPRSASRAGYIDGGNAGIPQSPGNLAADAMPYLFYHHGHRQRAAEVGDPGQ